MHRTLETHLQSSVQHKGASCQLPGALKRPMLQHMVSQGSGQQCDPPGQFRGNHAE